MGNVFAEPGPKGVVGLYNRSLAAECETAMQRLTRS